MSNLCFFFIIITYKKQNFTRECCCEILKPNKTFRKKERHLRFGAFYKSTLRYVVYLIHTKTLVNTRDFIQEKIEAKGKRDINNIKYQKMRKV
ncbi:hypothetical protein BpHYR1_013519 [Brachionus plicatilis]|uniref:Uncharacterized protein n=1 Tax=Brachionus plicatilis TaxID=10195 RepID=A0A3M7PKY7_BRAPC|nr:hypothetical protein BpHYR1_013519 [Brachionus plicatilis]